MKARAPSRRASRRRRGIVVHAHVAERCAEARLELARARTRAASCRRRSGAPPAPCARRARRRRGGRRARASPSRARAPGARRRRGRAALQAPARRAALEQQDQRVGQPLRLAEHRVDAGVRRLVGGQLQRPRRHARRAPERRPHRHRRARAIGQQRRRRVERPEPAQDRMRLALGRLRRRPRRAAPSRPPAARREWPRAPAPSSTPRPLRTNSCRPSVYAGVPSRAVSASTAGPLMTSTCAAAAPSAASATRRASAGSSPRDSDAPGERLAPQPSRQRRAHVAHELEIGAPPLGRAQPVAQQIRERQRIDAAHRAAATRPRPGARP